MSDSYRALFERAHVWRLTAALSAAWVSFGMLGLGVFFTAERATGSSALAGLVFGAFSVGAGALAPLRGRVIDRHGARLWLVVFTAGYGAALVALVVLTKLETPGWTLVAVALVAGASAPPLVATIRNLWSGVVEQRQLRRAYALTSLVSDIGTVVAPALAGLLFLLAWWSPLLACAFSAILAAVLAIRIAPSRSARPPDAGSGASPLATAPMRALLAVATALGLALGLVEIAVAASALGWGVAAWSGVLLGAFALGSVAGGLWFGRREWRRPAHSRFLLANLVLALALLPAAGATRPATLAALLFVAGLGYGPSTISLFEALDELAPTRGVEALTWVTTAEALGMAAGAALAGWATDRLGTWAPFAAASVVLGATTAAAVGWQAWWLSTVAAATGAEPQTPPYERA